MNVAGGWAAAVVSLSGASGALMRQLRFRTRRKYVHVGSSPAVHGWRRSGTGVPAPARAMELHRVMHPGLTVLRHGLGGGWLVGRLAEPRNAEIVGCILMHHDSLGLSRPGWPVLERCIKMHPTASSAATRAGARRSAAAFPSAPVRATAKNWVVHRGCPSSLWFGWGSLLGRLAEPRSGGCPAPKGWPQGCGHRRPAQGCAVSRPGRNGGNRRSSEPQQ